MFNLYLRTYQFSNPLLAVYRENFDLFNYYTLILPILSTIYFIKLLQHMAAPTLLQQNFNESYCIERGVLTATTTYYRVSLLITLVISIMSAISMINFIIRCHKAQFAQMAIIAERLVAIIFVRNYESGFKRLGPALLVTAIAANICTINFMYYGENFNAPQWNARTLPSTTLPRSSLALLVMLIMNFISLIVTISLYFFSRSHKGRTTLSSRFQSNENASVSNLLFLSSSLQFSTLFLLQMFNLYMRTYQIGNPLQTAYRENFDLFNFYTLILPILSTIYFIKVKRRRVRDIAIKINMKAKGNEGWTNYSIMIQRQWK
nr:7TM GPCR domain containing protein [Haemonchus contortus]